MFSCCTVCQDLRDCAAVSSIGKCISIAPETSFPSSDLLARGRGTPRARWGSELAEEGTFTPQMGLIQATAEYARWNKSCANLAGPRVLFPAQRQFQLSCGLPGLPQLPAYEAKAE